jgi:hypothetical protein
MIVDVIAPAPTVVDVLEPAPNVVEVSYVRGLTGATGEQGPQGPQGQKGSGGGKGEKGDTGSSGVVSVTAPITNTGTSTAANIGIDQTGLTLAQSQITNLLTDLGAKANLANPTFSGVLRAPLIAAVEGGKAAIRPNLDTGGIGIETNGSANKGLVVRGAASQSANLQEWQNSSGTVIARIEPSGRFGNTGGSYIGGPNGQIYATTTSASTIPLISRGAASQSANLQEWQNSAGTPQAKIDRVGVLYASAFLSNAQLFAAGELNSGGTIRMARSTGAGSGVANQVRLQVLTGTTGFKLVAVGSSGTVYTILDNIV